MEWISVKDKLPELDQVVIVYHTNFIDGNSAVVYNRPDKSGFILFSTLVEDDIYLEPGVHFTHWIPLPKKPK